MDVQATLHYVGGQLKHWKTVLAKADNLTRKDKATRRINHYTLIVQALKQMQEVQT